jgi:N-acetylmuramoyl-L-alanine amidase
MAVIKNGITLGKAKVIVDILPKGKVVTGDKNSDTSITIHNTGNWDVPAENFNRAIHNNNKGVGREASWHFTVDDKEIYQHIDTNGEAWHTGVGVRGNETSIGIEICMFKDEKRQKQAEDNAIALVHELFRLIPKLNVNTVRTHQSWSGKFCPMVILSRPNGWNDFVARIKAYKKPVVTQPKPVFKRLLKVTSPLTKGEDVKQVQKKLGIKVDGFYGNDTKNAVIKFQKSKKVTADGVVGKVTWTKLFN